jgi:hypothetical protein
MSWQRALNEVQGLLTQGGVPTNHSQDIVARFTAAMSDYYDFRENQAKSQEVTSDSASSSAFQNAFRSPEEYSGGTPGAAGAAGAGAYAWAAGRDGRDGSGLDGRDGNDGFNGFDGGGFGFGGIPFDLEALKKQLRDELKGKDGKDGGATCTKGKFSGQDICSILDQQAKELGKQRKKIEELEDKIKSIEKQLKDTVNC